MCLVFPNIQDHMYVDEFFTTCTLNHLIYSKVRLVMFSGINSNGGLMA